MAGNPGTQRTNLFKREPDEKKHSYPELYKVLHFWHFSSFIAENVVLFFFQGCSLARSLQYIPVKGLYKVCVGTRPNIWALRNCILC